MRTPSGLLCEAADEMLRRRAQRRYLAPPPEVSDLANPANILPRNASSAFAFLMPRRRVAAAAHDRDVADPLVSSGILQMAKAVTSSIGR